MTIALDGTPGHNSNSAGSPITASLTTSVAADVLVLFATINNGHTGTSVTDNSGVTAAWSLRKRNTNGNSILEEWSTTATGILSGATVTVNSNAGGGDFQTIDVFGVSGANTSSPFDSGGPISGNSDPQSITTANANTMLIGGARLATQNPTQGAGYTKISGADFQLTEYQAVSSANTYSVTVGTGVGTADGMIVDAIVQASGGGGATTSYGNMTMMGVGHHKGVGWTPLLDRRARVFRQRPRSLILVRNKLIVPRKKVA